jgi:cytoskeletal protein RodZ
MAKTKAPAPVKNIIICILLAVAVIGGGLYAYHKQHTTNTSGVTNSAKRAVNSVDYSPSKPSDNAENNARKSNPASANPTLDNGSTSTPTPTFSVTITRAGVVGDNFQVASLINGATAGTCTLSLSQTGQTTITQTNQVALQNNAYVCPVFSIPLSQFPNQGNWTVNLSVVSGAQTETAAWADNPVSLSGQ